MSWIQTYSGGRLDVLNPDPDEINLVDIAHHLSMLCRFTGAVKTFYSVASHSLMVRDILKVAQQPPPVVLQGLMHDTAEAYVNDLNRPTKLTVGAPYCDIEDGLFAVIADKYGFHPVLPPIVHWADNVALFAEKRELLPEMHWGMEDEEFYRECAEPWHVKDYITDQANLEQRLEVAMRVQIATVTGRSKYDGLKL